MTTPTGHSPRPPLTPREFHWLWYFAVVARERSLRRAAGRLFMSEPPLSRQIRALEERLGFALFHRHSRGLSLTAEGARVLAALEPLLAHQEQVFGELARLSTGNPTLSLGLTTAVEQGVFAPLETALRGTGCASPRITRAPSPRLLRELLRGRLDAAVVALPLEIPELPDGFSVTPLAHAEALVAVLPESSPLCPLTEGRALGLRELSCLPLFWFRRAENPAWFDHVLAVFRQAGFAPRLIEEAPEHDVLLARIARGEACGLFPASFAAIRRQGVRYAPLTEGALLTLRLGLVADSRSLRPGGMGEAVLRSLGRGERGAT